MPRRNYCKLCGQSLEQAKADVVASVTDSSGYQCY